ncbi:MBL fold metallo-hydrolase [Flaviaesturariibacter amylovorans]|uniref:Metallo-beta-lactamase domain-containing protein n=1 Tax=Flaviaesturariibacter amylovorans TaxID=1084520 RepID=A0ABP8GEH3_9BACT
MNRTAINNRVVTATAEHEIGKNQYVVAPGVWRVKDKFVNAFIVQNSEGTNNWVLVDAGIKSSASKIRDLAKTVFGSGNSRPTAIVLTHGHFDHVGALIELADEWGVPIYCHKLEVPFLTGKAEYPPADPSVGGGLMATMSFTFPRGPINVEDRLRVIEEDGTLPGLPEWRWLHTPGHAPGHISIYRERDGVLVAGDALTTTNQNSAISVMTQKKTLLGPPAYFTIDWGAAARSVRLLAQLQPQVIATGHGQSMYGAEARKALNKLTREFWDIAMPEEGRYVHEPALTNEDGVTYIPPEKKNYTFVATIAVAAVAIGLGIYLMRQRRRNRQEWAAVMRQLGDAQR